MTTTRSQPPGGGLGFVCWGMDVKSPNPPGKVLVSVSSATWGGGGKTPQSVFVPVMYAGNPLASASALSQSPWENLPAIKSQGERRGRNSPNPSAPSQSTSDSGQTPAQPPQQDTATQGSLCPRETRYLTDCIQVCFQGPRTRRRVRPRTVALVPSVPLHRRTCR